MQLAPITLFVYNRPNHTQQTIEALLKNPLASQSELFIFSDSPKDKKATQSVQQVRNYIHSIRGFKNITIIERERNFGLADSIIDGVTQVINQYEKIIVLEDDLLVSPHFLQYMNDSLQFYKNEEKVACITGFVFPSQDLQALQEDTFFLKGADCWTWATWKRSWDLFNPNGNELLQEITARNLQKEFDFQGSYPYTQMLKQQIEGKNSSWAILWYASAFLHNMLCLYPKQSLVENIGTDGTHFKHANKDLLFGKMTNFIPHIHNIQLVENHQAKEAFIHFFQSYNHIFFKLKRKIKSLIKGAIK